MLDLWGSGWFSIERLGAGWVSEAVVGFSMSGSVLVGLLRQWLGFMEWFGSGWVPAATICFFTGKLRTPSMANYGLIHRLFLMIQQSFHQFNGIFKHLVGFSVVGSGPVRFFVKFFFSLQ